MPPSEAPFTGGCQCGAVRFAVGRLGRGSICHCRMCQKAFGAFFGPLVTSFEVTWTRGAPKYFESSDRIKRGFCAECGIGHFESPALATQSDLGYALSAWEPRCPHCQPEDPANWLDN